MLSSANFLPLARSKAITKSLTVRLDRDRAERHQKKEEEAARREAEQPALFTF
jgi:hypothetical protein